MRDNITAIVYTSSTGFTRRYAQLLGEKTGLPVYDLKGADRPAKGTAVVFLSWLCAGKLKGFQTAVKRYSVQVVCAVGMGDEETNRPQRLAPSLGFPPGPNFFYLRGGYAPERLKGLMKFLMGLMYKAVSKKPPVDDAGREMLEAFQHGGDWVSAEKLDPVVAWLEG